MEQEKSRKTVSQINYRMVSSILGVLLQVEAGLFLLCAGISLHYKEAEYVCFLEAAAVNAIVGILLLLLGKGRTMQITRRDGYFVVSASWLFFTFFGMLPYYLSGSIPSLTDAFFETMSGFTTTGATILDDIEALPYGLLFWRSLTQWIGGLGIVLFTIAILPMFGESSQQLFNSESIGVTKSKIHPKARMMVRYLWIIYLGLTLLETILLMLGGMSLYDAVCHSLTTTSTGGFSTKQDSIAHWNSSYIEYVVAVFMLLSGVNFTLYFMALRGKANTLLEDKELHWYLKSIGILTLIVTVVLFVGDYYGVEESFRKSFFQVVSIHTSTGFATDDYLLWPPSVWMFILFAMLAGGCTGSTGGGIKNLRLLIIVKSIKNQFKQMLHPRAVLPIRVNDKSVPLAVSASVFIYFAIYLLCLFGGWTLLMFMGVGMTEAMSTAFSALGNTGPALGAYGPAFSWASLPDAAKWLLSLLMFIGRLEIFGILILFYRGFWRDKL